MTQINSRIQQRHDTLANWTTNNIVLLNGELAVVDCGDCTKFKIGNGLSTFNQLQFVDQNVICTDWAVAKAISQGTHAHSVPLGLAAGAYLSAGANYSQALGYNAQSLSSDLYSFVWSGDDTRSVANFYVPTNSDFYSSHGKGSFSINPLSGLSGIFIGEQSLAELLDAKGGNKITIDDRISGICQQSNLSVVKLYADDYYQLVSSGNALSNCLYVVQNQFSNMYGRQIKNVAPPTDLSDAVNKEYVDDAISNVQIPTDLSAFANSPGYLVSNDISDIYKKSETSSSSEISNELKKYQLSGNYLSSNALENYYAKSETSSASEISVAFELSSGNKVFIDDRISGIAERIDLSIIHLSSSEYEQLSVDGQILSNALYIVEDSALNNYDQQIKNVAEPTDASDAATKGYVDNAVSSIQIPTDLSSFRNSPGYLVSNDISSYKKYNDTVTSLSNDGYITSALIDNTLGSIQKSVFAAIADPQASVRSIQETLIQILNILRDQENNNG